jgi:glycosyltransferase involved in cell wall biosynthesis
MLRIVTRVDRWLENDVRARCCRYTAPHSMTKLIIQIPCFNEEGTLGITLDALPRSVPGVDCVEWLVIDDGSADGTVRVAQEHGVDHIVSLPRNVGLARAFQAGIEACLARNADLIVNTDADNQYCADHIPSLVEPILAGRAEFVIGARPVQTIAHFSPVKKFLQRFGSWAVRVASGTDVPDAPSGFRAISREAALQLNVFDPYTYTLETIIQAGRRGIPTESVPIPTNEELRPSRLVRSKRAYVGKSVLTILRIFMVYRPFQFFAMLGSVPLSAGVLLGLRWLFYFGTASDRTRLPSLILVAILVLVGVQLFMFGLVANLMSVNRRLLEDVQVRLRRASADARVQEFTAGGRRETGA